jgi:hypothetical protein
MAGKECAAARIFRHLGQCRGRAGAPAALECCIGKSTGSEELDRSVESNGSLAIRTL